MHDDAYMYDVRVYSKVIDENSLLTLARGPRPPDMASTVKMRWLPGARMATPGARAQGAVARGILWPVPFHGENGWTDCSNS
eukprot:COSAG05_NODE_32_length_28165_cov_450.666714_17_plen_82_part_00